MYFEETYYQPSQELNTFCILLFSKEERKVECLLHNTVKLSCNGNDTKFGQIILLDPFSVSNDPGTFFRERCCGKIMLRFIT